MKVLKKLSSLKPWEILKVKVPELLSSIEDEEVDGLTAAFQHIKPGMGRAG